jgi:putative colanic acid biosynthesis acetyltransferase WcaF
MKPSVNTSGEGGHERRDIAGDPYLLAKVSPWTLREKIWRALWMLIGRPLLRLSWHNWYGYRRGILRLFGARIGKECVIRPTVHIYIPWNLSMGDISALGDYAIVYNLGMVTIGNRVTVSQYAHLCAGSHDYTRREMPLLRPTITVGDDVWIAADAYIGPSVTVGDGAIVGARSSVFRDVPPWTIVAGNPAKVMKQRPPIKMPDGSFFGGGAAT